MTPKPIDELSAAELRREIAERLGYRIHEIIGGRHGRFVCIAFSLKDFTPKGLEDFSDHVRAYPTEEDAWTGPDVPDWPNSPGDALTLCEEIAEPYDWAVLVGRHHVTMKSATFVKLTDLGTYEDVIFKGKLMAAMFCDTPALALSRLACAALRAQGGDDAR
jgi:hypothetical protein